MATELGLQGCISVREVDLRRLDPGAWDSHAIRAGASLRSAHAHLRALRLKSFYRSAPRVFEVLLDVDGAPRVVGQFTALAERGRTVFYDGLNLLPEHRDLWRPAMQAALRALGPGAYEYGWPWRPEPPRDEDLAALPHLRIEAVRHAHVQGVDFADWPDWDAYYRDVSENSRRNARKAQQRHPVLRVDIATGLKSLPRTPNLAALRSAMYGRKDLSFSATRAFLSYVANILTCPSQFTLAAAMSGDRMLAISRGSTFGDQHYYLDGAAAPQSEGGAWFLQLFLLRRAFEATPKGRYLLGWTWQDSDIEKNNATGLQRSRRSLRASDWPTSVVRFEWRPG